MVGLGILCYHNTDPPTLCSPPEHFDLKFSLQLSDLSASFCGIFTKASILDGISGPFVEMKNQSSFGESLMSKNLEIHKKLDFYHKIDLEYFDDLLC